MRFRAVIALDALTSRTADAFVVARYCTRMYEETGSYVETGARLGLDRRTVKEHVDSELLAERDG
jgi:hypothetical protein